MRIWGSSFLPRLTGRVPRPVMESFFREWRERADSMTAYCSRWPEKMKVTRLADNPDRLAVELTRVDSPCLFSDVAAPKIVELTFNHALINFETLSGRWLVNARSDPLIIQEVTGLRQLPNLEKLIFRNCQIFDEGSLLSLMSGRTIEKNEPVAEILPPILDLRRMFEKRPPAPGGFLEFVAASAGKYKFEEKLGRLEVFGIMTPDEKRKIESFFPDAGSKAVVERLFKSSCWQFQRWSRTRILELIKSQVFNGSGFPLERCRESLFSTAGPFCGWPSGVIKKCEFSETDFGSSKCFKVFHLAGRRSGARIEKMTGVYFIPRPALGWTGFWQ